MLPELEEVNLTPSSTEFASFTFTIAGTSLAKNRLELAALMVKVNVAVPVPVPLVALNVTLDVPVAVGVPEMTPVAVLTESPAANPVALKLVGLLLAVMV